MLDVKTVDLGVKSAYLYDIGPPIGENLQGFIADLVEESLISSYLNIVEVEMDCLIVKAESVYEIKENLEKNCENQSLKFIDITNDSDSVLTNSEDIRTEIKETVNNISANMASDKVHLYVLPHTLSCNRTSLFGVLLGYPVIYWFHESKHVGQNFLSLVPLCCITVFSELVTEKENSKDDKHTLYSFSYPACHDGILKDIGNEWFGKLKTKCEGTSLEKLSMISVEKSFEAICL